MKTDVSSYTGKWIAICNNQIIASGRDVKKVYKKAKEKFPKKRPLITRIPDKATMIF